MNAFIKSINSLEKKSIFLKPDLFSLTKSSFILLKRLSIIISLCLKASVASTGSAHISLQLDAIKKKKKLWLLFSFDREQTHWQSQIPRAPWGGQSKKIYEWEDERCAVEGGGNPCSNQEHPWMTVSGKGRKQQHPRLPLPFKTTTVRKHSVSPAVSTMTQWIIQFTDYGLIRDRLWAS